MSLDDTLLSLLDAGTEYDVLTYGYPCSSLTLHRSSQTYYARWSASESRQEVWVHAEAISAAGALRELRKELKRRVVEASDDKEVPDDCGNTLTGADVYGS